MITKALNAYASNIASRSVRLFATNDTFSKFPKHKELFADDYYDQEGDKAQAKSPYEKAFLYGNDSENFDKGSVKSTPSGILANYKKQLNLNASEIMQKDYWNQFDKVTEDTARKLRETKPEVFSKEFMTRMRLNRDLNAPMQKDGHEYGDYEKYEKNKIELKIEKGVEDTGDNVFVKKYQNMLRQMNTPEGDTVRDHDDISMSQTVESYRTNNAELDQKYNHARESFDFHDTIQHMTQEAKLFKSWDDTQMAVVGRLSPFAKESVYRAYLKGATVKDLSLKFGIFPQRVKAIVYQKHLYWEEVYPRMGETHMRLAIEREAHYAATYPFVDYGADMAAMAQEEQGMRIERLKRSEADMKPQDVKERAEVEYFLSRLKSRMSDKVPEKFVGKSHHGYLLYDWAFHKTKRAAKVSQCFKDIVRYKNTKMEHLIRPKLLDRCKAGGVRFAVMKNKHK